jgi:hypothetical protein
MTNEPTPLTFETKKGFCHVFDDRIVLTNDGDCNRVDPNPRQQERSMFVYLYAFMALYLLFQAVENLQMARYFGGVTRILIVVALIAVVVKSINTTGVPLILRKDIVSVVFSPARQNMTRAYFTVLYKNNNGAVKRRLIMLPGSLSGGADATEKALAIMTEKAYI